MEVFVNEIKEHFTRKLIPFWKNMKDEENGGFYGYMGYDLSVDQKYEKGSILNSRILWFFSNAYLLLKDKSLRPYAFHAYRFLKEKCLDREYGGVYWLMNYDGTPKDTGKHVYSQSFAIYALSSYYAAFGDEEALKTAKEIRDLVEEKCRDAWGYGEAYSRRFLPEQNEKLSENGVMAEKTMNTLLHLFEAYTELYRVCGDGKAAEGMGYMLDLMAGQVYNGSLGRQEVFFDRKWNSLIDLYSYGHDIETAWLVDRGLEILGDEGYTKRISPITRTLTENIYSRAFDGSSLPNEAEGGVVDDTRVWWVQAEAVVGFLNGYQKEPEKKKYLKAAKSIWGYIRDHLADSREGSEWYWCLDRDKKPVEKPIVEPWKCPYHNGRMCMEVIRRMDDVT